MEIETTLAEIPKILLTLKQPPTTKIKIIVEESLSLPSKEKTSKWAKLIDDIEEMEIPSEVFDHIQECSTEFREDFAFKQDLIEEEPEK